MTKFVVLLLHVATFAALVCACPAFAADKTPVTESREKLCMKKAEELPDMAAADADAWFRKGGGNAALLCRATARFHSGDFNKAAADFESLGAVQNNSRNSALVYEQAGLAWLSAQDYRKADAAYSRAISFEKEDPDLWMNRANARAGAQNYWDAISDLNKALEIMPDMPEALRLRGQVWYKLGVSNKAENDFHHIAEIQAEEDVAASKKRPAATRTK